MLVNSILTILVVEILYSFNYHFYGGPRIYSLEFSPARINFIILFYLIIFLQNG